MKLVMRVVEGPGDRREFVFPAEGESEGEATDILVGRDDVDCHAHWRLSKEDPTVSRAHLLLEIRPPNCQVQDNGSLNGVYLRRGDEPERRVVKELLQNGDRLRLGKTVVEFEIHVPLQPVETVYVEEQPPAPEPKPATTPPLPEPLPAPTPVSPSRPPEKEPEWFCVRCGERLDKLPDLETLARSLDFMCPRCRKEVEAELRQAEERSRERYVCSECGQDVTEMAKSDGRAAALKDVALYLCPRCGNKAKEKYTKSPKQIVGYWVLKSLGSGGVGEVLKGWHPQTGRIVAIKRMHSKVSTEERMVRRFRREIAIMETLSHPNVVRLYESGILDGVPVFVSEFVPGGDLTQFIGDEGRSLLPPTEIVSLIAESLVGLEYFHRQGYVHRDLKPENILLARKDGQRIPKIADFGFARSFEKHGGTVTRTGEFAGTWMYMPPEQITDFKHARPPLDVYAMGATTYVLLSGWWPLPDFPSFSAVQQGRLGILKRSIPQMILHDRRVPLEERRPDLPRALCRVVDKAIAMEARNRYQSAEEFRQALLKSI
jgi:DNA-directed RNA polymerase subunit RPC12/RpoP